jgi:hypothetical protein
MHASPLLQSAAALQLAPRMPLWQVRFPSRATATQLPSTQSPSSRHAEPGTPGRQSPELLEPFDRQRPVPQSASD